MSSGAEPRCQRGLISGSRSRPRRGFARRHLRRSKHELWAAARLHAREACLQGLLVEMRSSSREALDEAQRALPGVCGSVGVVLLLAVEEAVRGAFVRDELVLDAGRTQRRFERGIVL